MSTVRILAFGRIAEITGRAPQITVAGDSDELQQILWQRFPELKGLKYKIAINQRVITEKTVLPENAEVALLPPFSGG